MTSVISKGHIRLDLSSPTPGELNWHINCRICKWREDGLMGKERDWRIT